MSCEKSTDDIFGPPRGEDLLHLFRTAQTGKHRFSWGFDGQGRPWAFVSRGLRDVWISEDPTNRSKYDRSKEKDAAIKRLIRLIEQNTLPDYLK